MRRLGTALALRGRLGLPGWLGLLGWLGLWGGLAACDDGAALDPAPPPDPYADRVVSFTPGPGAGYGADKLPAVVLGPPHGAGDAAGSLDVVSLGQGGTLVLALDDQPLIDGPGPDLLVFENPFAGYIETARVAVSADGAVWHEWPCASQQPPDYPGCAGVEPVYSAPGSKIAATDWPAAGGDAFDLADLGAIGPGPFRFVRVVDSGSNPSAGSAAGFDLDAVAVLHHP